LTTRWLLINVKIIFYESLVVIDIFDGDFYSTMPFVSQDVSTNELYKQRW